MPKKSTGQSVQGIAIHVLFWALYVASEYFANLLHMQPGRNLRFLHSTLLTLPTIMVPTYFIAWYVVPRYLKTERWTTFLLWIIGVGVFTFFARIKWAEGINYMQSGEYFKIPVSKLLKNIIRDYAIIALGVCVSILADYRRKQKQNEQLIKARAEAEIQLLKGQLHPHFLFNSLNNIYSLALLKSDQTADSILKLTELLEYLLYHANKEKVVLSKEVQLLENYIALEKLRYGEHLMIESELHLRSDNISVAPLILLPFAENCFKHGGPGQDQLFHIRIYLEATDHKLKFHISNSIKTGRDTATHPGGLGLDNIRQRLTLLYPDRHRLQITGTSAIFEVQLEILFRDGEL